MPEINPDLSRRHLLRLGLVTGGAVALLPWGGRAMAGPAATAAGARQLADGPVPTGGKLLANTGFMFPDLDPFIPDPDPGVATSDLLTLANSLFDPNATDRDQAGSFGCVLTYFGQFVDHDNFLDLVPQPTALFSRDNQGNLLDPGGAIVPNYESFRFDLSSVYGGGPDISPQLYEADKLHFRIQEPNPNGVRDLPRDSSDVAVLVEKRNDENQIIAQVHIAFLRFHNAVADALHTGFADTYATVRRYYQWIVIHQFLPEICGADVVSGLLDGSIPSLYKPQNPNAPMVPAETQVAAYRFGHSMVRKAYEVTINDRETAGIQRDRRRPARGQADRAGRQIDWGNFVRPLMRPENAAHFNVPRFIDTLISSGLFALPIGGPGGAEPSGSTILPFRNLLRGFFYGLPSGQDVARKMGETVIPAGDALPDAVDIASVSAAVHPGHALVVLLPARSRARRRAEARPGRRAGWSRTRSSASSPPTKTDCCTTTPPPRGGGCPLRRSRPPKVSSGSRTYW